MPRINWQNKEEVIAFAVTLGRGMVVLKRPGYSNYNITHAERNDRYKEHWVVYRT